MSKSAPSVDLLRVKEEILAAVGSGNPELLVEVRDLRREIGGVRKAVEIIASSARLSRQS